MTTPDNNNITFKKWLLSQFKDADSAIGDLARDAREDRTFPTLRAANKLDGSRGYRYLR